MAIELQIPFTLLVVTQKRLPYPVRFAEILFATFPF